MMTTTQLLSEINRLPLPERLRLVELAIHSIRQETPAQPPMAEAAQQLLADYQSDADLTAFTALDGESFYETCREPELLVPSLQP